MLFSSLPFLFGFFPAVMILVWLSERYGGTRVSLSLLVIVSLFFYAWWNPPVVILLIISVLVNYAFGVAICRAQRRDLLALAVLFNLGLIGYFKYAGLLAETLSMLPGVAIDLGTITLPLAISFFTFQQIAYQVDVYQGKVRDTDFVHYCLFVTFFPQLIAGPIVHHQEIIPQFEERKRFNITLDNLAAGGLIFAIGLYKKVVIADGIAAFSDSVFDRALENPNVFEAWGGALAYGMQIYFDFSGYSDMAIGLARMFGIRLPANFASPYKAASIIEFWQTWHMTLSRFLRDYLYIPLGGNRRGDARRYANLIITMLLGGLWHGASWTFVFWGGLHGMFLMINHLWRRIRGPVPSPASPASRIAGRALTFLAVMVAWVFFRAESWDAAVAMIHGMIGMNGLGALDGSWALLDPGLYLWLCVLLPVVWLAPNTQELACDRDPVIGFVPDPALQNNILWRRRRQWFVLFAIACAIAALIVVVIRKSASEDFIYMVF